MPGTLSDPVRRWVSAYVDGRDEDMVALAHADIVLHPRVGQGDPEYRGLDGVRAWLANVGKPPPPFELDNVEELDEARVLVEGSIHATSIVALFEVREDRIRAVTSYVSDRRMLEHLGRI